MQTIKDVIQILKKDYALYMNEYHSIGKKKLGSVGKRMKIIKEMKLFKLKTALNTDNIFSD